MQGESGQPNGSGKPPDKQSKPGQPGFSRRTLTSKSSSEADEAAAQAVPRAVRAAPETLLGGARLAGASNSCELARAPTTRAVRSASGIIDLSSEDDESESRMQEEVGVEYGGQPVVAATANEVKTETVMLFGIIAMYPSASKAVRQYMKWVDTPCLDYGKSPLQQLAD